MDWEQYEVRLETCLSLQDASEDSCRSRCYWQPSNDYEGSPSWNEADTVVKETVSSMTLLNVLNNDPTTSGSSHV